MRGKQKVSIIITMSAVAESALNISRVSVYISTFPE